VLNWDKAGRAASLPFELADSARPLRLQVQVWAENDFGSNGETAHLTLWELLLTVSVTSVFADDLIAVGLVDITKYGVEATGPSEQSCPLNIPADFGEFHFSCSSEVSETTALPRPSSSPSGQISFALRSGSCVHTCDVILPRLVFIVLVCVWRWEGDFVSATGTPSVSMTLESITGVRLGGLTYGNLQPPSRPGDVWMLPDSAANRIAAFPFVRSVLRDSASGFVLGPVIVCGFCGGIQHDGTHVCEVGRRMEFWPQFPWGCQRGTSVAM
jgi:hypothetical protein